MVSVKASASSSHVGRVRTSNQDSGFEGTHLFVVADGMGGHAGGDIASSLAVEGLAEVDRDYVAPGDFADALKAHIHTASANIAKTADEHPQLTGMGTTFTALGIQGNTAIVQHIGDSRMYLLRGGELSQISTDHTFVQRLLDAGRITEDEARVHPRRSVLMRVLGDVESQPDPDTMLLNVHDGDRWLICSDGLSGVVEFDQIREHMTRTDGAKPVVDRLMKAALEGGAPDNVTIVVVDIGEPEAPVTPPLILGAAANPPSIVASETPNRTRSLRIGRPSVVEHFEPESDEFLDQLIREQRRRATRRRLIWIGSVLGLVAVLVALGAAFYSWTQSRYFVGQKSGVVVIYQGVQQDIGPLSLHSVYEKTDIAVADLNAYDQKLVEETISADSLEEAHEIVDRLEEHASSTTTDTSTDGTTESSG